MIKGCFQTVTIWNKWRNHSTGKDEFYRHVLPVPCKWKNHIQRSISDSTANIASSIIAMIPYSDTYRSATEWKALDADGRSAFWTLQTGDLMALGDQSTEITGVKPYTTSDVLTALAPNVMTIKGFQDNTQSTHGRHYRVEGV